MTKREKLIKDLKKLYQENVDFIAQMQNGTANRKYTKKCIKEFKKLNSQLDDYIQDVENGLEMDKTVEDWCSIFADTLLDDDNFWIEEDGFSWH